MTLDRIYRINRIGFIKCGQGKRGREVPKIEKTVNGARCTVHGIGDRLVG